MQNKYIDEEQNFIKTISFFNKHSNQISDEEKFFFEAWYKIIYTECSKIYTIDKIRKIKRNILEECRNKIIKIESERKIGLDYNLQIIFDTEERQLKKLEEKINTIETMEEEELLDIIVRSLFISEEQIKLLKEEKEIKELEKFKNLSYGGKKCVDGEIINEKILKKIYNDIKQSHLLDITERVKELEKTNDQFQKLKSAKTNSKSTIYFKIVEIYKEKIDKIKHEIKNELSKISKHKYLEYIDSKDINLIRLRTQIEKDLEKAQTKIAKFVNPKKEERLKELLSTINGTIEHEKIQEEYDKKIEITEYNKLNNEIYNNSAVARIINEEKTKILGSTGVIINNLNEDIIEKLINDFKKEIDEAAKTINEQITILATREEHNRIKNFAKKIGMSVENTLKLLTNEDNIYICLYTYIFGTEIQNKIVNPSIAENLLGELEPRFQTKERTLKNMIENNYECKERQNTKALTTKKRTYFKIPSKD